MAKHDINSLPQWAQERISQLESEVVELRHALEKATDDLSPTNLAVIDTINFGGDKLEVRKFLSGSRVEVYGGEVTIVVTPGKAQG